MKFKVVRFAEGAVLPPRLDTALLIAKRRIPTAILHVGKKRLWIEAVCGARPPRRGWIECTPPRAWAGEPLAASVGVCGSCYEAVEGPAGGVD